ncbi:bifunctional phosphopantothenoylcysteine decarboxylase/phosphopantothenate--cysteine ligase CoaBC [Moritella sp. Urea-trap-13]|uniref:bifunctional phosphopantothenoylcysteine decarboxylase/phosphopantothenate--cysteine ligase CoaBC n=1 Tax=Moritella sp. Urea-trap-13 TaxID=2058327 RepID=UPI000C34E60F|nr:bifunctional phosphopantothenoylcysteine decarboxylase/phosphopantothenate--cysteine ligase CoaBC [Moritella sp. Urea-trap-13]PKH07541.1 bifunctional phosphopantothenoylcysteine decarboxylase/phosphopantothenate--cysteine ligase CoaBC [Moritella sp. Urea-trap-13]
MTAIANKRILLGITGGIAAYKCAELTRRLTEQGAEVRVVMTQSAQEFITPLTMQAVSGNPVAHSLLDPAAEAGMGHIEFAKWADLVLIAPATANFIAKFTAGIADDLLSTLCLATPAPIAIAPAMNQVMYQAAATQANLATLKQRNIMLWGPAAGAQACGDVGPGRMVNPDELVTAVADYFSEQAQINTQAQLLAGKNIMITAGPTREAIDPVRYISNHSSGKMGYALAQAARSLGANVTVVSGPVALAAPNACHLVKVTSALDMHAAVMADIHQQDIFIACAAVADYRPENIAEQKIKKTNSDEMVVRMIKNPDIVASVAALENSPFTVGFAAETQDVEHYARDKMQRKNLAMIAANDVAQSGQGFNADNNALTVFWPQGTAQITLASKQAVAVQLLQLIATQFNANT